MSQSGQIEALSSAQEQGWKDRIAPAVEQVGPGTWAIPVPIPDNPLVYTYCYAIAEDKGVSLIDPGWNGAEQFQRLEDGLAGIGYAISDINGVAISHYHRDHLGQVPALQERNPDIWVAMQRHDVEAVSNIVKGTASLGNGVSKQADIVSLYGVPEERRGEIDKMTRESRKQASGRADEPYIPALDSVNLVMLEHDDTLPLTGRTVRGLWTPGHTYGHTAFLDPELGAFFSGDHLLPKITPNIGLDAGALTHSLGDYLNSLERMQALDDSLQVLPAHGFRFAGLHARAAQISEHHAERLDEVRARMEVTDDHSAYSIAQGLHWSRGFDALHDFNLFAALAETAAHMYYLGLPVGE